MVLRGVIPAMGSRDAELLAFDQSEIATTQE